MVVRQRRRIIPLVVTTAFTLVLPPTAVPQGTPVGVVATLDGKATLNRVALPQTTLLKPRDPLYVADRVTTGDRATARILLGGKALITVRERTVLTVKEAPAVSTIDVGTGRMAIAVVKERMKPGETIEIRTPNAVAGIRGTIVVTDVSGATSGDTSGVTTTITVLRGLVEVHRLDPQTGQHIGAPVNLARLESLRVSQSSPLEGRRSITVDAAQRLSAEMKVEIKDVPATKAMTAEAHLWQTAVATGKAVGVQTLPHQHTASETTQSASASAAPAPAISSPSSATESRSTPTMLATPTTEPATGKVSAGVAATATLTSDAAAATEEAQPAAKRPKHPADKTKAAKPTSGMTAKKTVKSSDGVRSSETDSTEPGQEPEAAGPRKGGAKLGGDHDPGRDIDRTDGGSDDAPTTVGGGHGAHERQVSKSERDSGRNPGEVASMTTTKDAAAPAAAGAPAPVKMPSTETPAGLAPAATAVMTAAPAPAASAAVSMPAAPALPSAPASTSAPSPSPAASTGARSIPAVTVPAAPMQNALPIAPPIAVAPVAVVTAPVTPATVAPLAAPAVAPVTAPPPARAPIPVAVSVVPTVSIAAPPPVPAPVAPKAPGAASLEAPRKNQEPKNVVRPAAAGPKKP